MTTETDLATIQAVTDKLVGPLKVWVLTTRNTVVEVTSLFYSKQGALAAAERGMMTGYSKPQQSEWERAMKELAAAHHTLYRDNSYHLELREIEP